MKRLLCILLVCIFLNVNFVSIYAITDVTVTINGQEIEWENFAIPYIENNDIDNVMLPLKKLVSVLGGSYKELEAQGEQRAIITINNKMLLVIIGSRIYAVSNIIELDDGKFTYDEPESYYLDKPADLKNGDVFFPLKHFCAVFGNTVKKTGSTFDLIFNDILTDKNDDTAIFNEEQETSIPIEESPLTEEEMFPNEKPSSWAVTHVMTAINARLVPKDLQSDYTQAITRAEFCALAVTLYETVTGNEIIDSKTFDDTKDVNVEKVAALGVVAGTGNNKFSPDSHLTREQAAVMLSNLANAVGKPLEKKATTFADKDSISSWAIECVGQVQAAGIMSGVGNNKFESKSLYTREQSIITILTLYNVVK